MPVDGVGLGHLVPLALLRDHVEEGGAVQGLEVLQDVDEPLEVVAVHRAHVADPPGVEGVFLVQKELRRLLGPVHEAEKLGGDAFQDVLPQLLRVLDPLPDLKLLEVLVEGPHVLGDAHLVVVEDDEHPLLELPILLRAARAIPPVKAPSPITATTW